MFENIYWAWLILAAVLIILEVTMPIYYFLWIGATAALVGFISWLFPSIDLSWQLGLFTILSMISIVSGRAYLKSNPSEEIDTVTLNNRAEQYIGRTLVLENPIINGQTTEKIDGLFWKINGPDCDAGCMVKIIGVHQKSILIVEVIPHAKGE